MPTTPRLSRAAAVLLPLALLVAACDDGTSNAPPSAATSKQNNPLQAVPDAPQSILGKSAQMGKSVAQQAASSQDAAGAMADELSGQAGNLTISGVEFRPPSSWTKTAPANRMQTAAFQIGEGTGNDATLCVFLAGMGGSTQQNIDRWRGQVTNPSTGQPAESKVETHTAAGIKITMVSMEGTYASMVSGATTPIQNQGFRGAIVEALAGPIFVRLTGPKDQVAGATDAWRKMVLGITRQ